MYQYLYMKLHVTCYIYTQFLFELGKVDYFSTGAFLDDKSIRATKTNAFEQEYIMRQEREIKYKN